MKKKITQTQVSADRLTSDLAFWLKNAEAQIHAATLPPTERYLSFVAKLLGKPYDPRLFLFMYSRMPAEFRALDKPPNIDLWHMVYEEFQREPAKAGRRASAAKARPLSAEAKRKATADKCTPEICAYIREQRRSKGIQSIKKLVRRKYGIGLGTRTIERICTPSPSGI